MLCITILYVLIKHGNDRMPISMKMVNKFWYNDVMEYHATVKKIELEP